MGSRPNVLLVILDTVRASHVSCYGYHRSTTPNIDAFAGTATKYEYAISEGCWTVPSHASVFTGEPSTVHGSHAYRRSFDPPEGSALAELLADRGYHTAAASRNAWITRERGFDRGFDRFDDRDHAQLFEESFDIRSAIRRHEGKDAPRRYANILKDGLTSGRPLRALVNLAYFKYRDSQYCDDGATVNNRFAKDVFEKGEEPWFLFLNYMEAHEPYYEKWAHDSQFSPDRPMPREESDERAKWEYHAGRTDPSFDALETLYDADIELLDRRVGNLLEALEERGVREDTLVIIAGDHGQHFGEHGMMAHIASPYPQAIRVPLLVSEPGQTTARVEETPVSLRSIYRWILAATGDAVGEQVWDIDDESPPVSHCFGSHEDVFDEFPELDRDRWSEHLATAVVETGEGPVGVVRGDRGRTELYGIENSTGDPPPDHVVDETIREELDSELAAMADERGSRPDRAVSTRLQDLGYL